MKITILCAGKIKERYFSDGIKEYSKRLSRYAMIEIKEVQDEKTPDRASTTQEEKIKELEGERLLSHLVKIKGKDSLIITLEIKGKEFNSEALAERFLQAMNEGKSHLVFVIGGSLGLSPEVSKEADLKLSFSKLTFPHQLMRLILVEQIYRSFRIIHNEPYHK